MNKINGYRLDDSFCSVCFFLLRVPSCGFVDEKLFFLHVIEVCRTQILWFHFPGI